MPLRRQGLQGCRRPAVPPAGASRLRKHLDTPIDYESLKTALGSMMGSGGPDRHGRRQPAWWILPSFFLDFIQSMKAAASASPCRDRHPPDAGDPPAYHAQSAARKGQGRRHGALPGRGLDGAAGAGTSTNRALCGLGQTAPNPVLSARCATSADEYEAHIREKPLPGRGHCKALLSFTHPGRISASSCGLCAKVCSAGAITGSPRNPYYIIPEKCIRCGGVRDGMPVCGDRGGVKKYVKCYMLNVR